MGKKLIVLKINFFLELVLSHTVKSCIANKKVNHQVVCWLVTTTIIPTGYVTCMLITILISVKTISFQIFQTNNNLYC